MTKLSEGLTGRCEATKVGLACTCRAADAECELTAGSQVCARCGHTVWCVTCGKEKGFGCLTVHQEDMKGEFLTKMVLKRETSPVRYDASKSYRNLEDVVPMVRQLLAGEVQEVSLALFFPPGGNQLLGYMEVARGTRTSVSTDPKLVLTAALLCGATDIVLAHNHPSGSARPSRQDVVMTKSFIKFSLM